MHTPTQQTTYTVCIVQNTKNKNNKNNNSLAACNPQSNTASYNLHLSNGCWNQKFVYTLKNQKYSIETHYAKGTNQKN